MLTFKFSFTIWLLFILAIKLYDLDIHRNQPFAKPKKSVQHMYKLKNKNFTMNKFLLILFMQFLLSATLYAQKDVTQFLGIPIDGNKSEIIKKLKDKGFIINPYIKDVLEGEFNGTKVNLHVVTNNNKVYRIMVADANSISETDIKIRFNRLCQQFQNNKKYLSTPLLDSGYTIPEEEDISYELLVNKKRYEAVFYQQPAKKLDTIAFQKELQEVILKKYAIEQLSNPTEEIQKNIIMDGVSYMIDKYSKKMVWFMINEDGYGKYSIIMFYDNEYNKPDGEDF